MAKKTFKKFVIITSLSKLVDAIELAADEGKNPKTPEEWEALVLQMIRDDMVDAVIPVADSTEMSSIKKALKDEGFNASDLKGE